MNDRVSPTEVVEHFRLSADEDLLLTAWQYRMMQRDIAATKGKALELKRSARDEFRNRVVEVMQSQTSDEFATVQTKALIADMKSGRSRSETFQLLEDSPTELTDVVSSRSRAMLLLIDIYGFEPWPGVNWTAPVRRAAMEEFRDALNPLRDEDLAAVSNAYDAAVKALAAKNRRWSKVALFGAAGLGLGVLTVGLATPVVGAIYGSAILGYSGAAAASAGLAALGGGSLAAGGLGMAGGTALIAGVGGAAGLSAGSAGAHLFGLTAGQVAADVIRLEVATQLVLRDVEGDNQAAKAVVLALREKMLTLRHQLVDLTRRIEQLKSERDAAVTTVKAERRARAEQGTAIRQLRDQISLSLQRGTADTAALTELDAQLRRLELQCRANKLVAEFVESRAEVLDRST